MKTASVPVTLRTTGEQQQQLEPLFAQLRENGDQGAILICANKYSMTARYISPQECQDINQTIAGTRCTRSRTTLRMKDRAGDALPSTPGASAATNTAAHTETLCGTLTTTN